MMMKGKRSQVLRLAEIPVYESNEIEIATVPTLEENINDANAGP